MVVTSSQMLAAEQAVIAGGVTAEALMDEASEGIFQVIKQFLPTPGTAVLYLGTGNNAGDALVVGKHLLAAGWHVLLRCAQPGKDFKELPGKRWGDIYWNCGILSEGVPFGPVRGENLLIVDGILGTGTTPSPLRGEMADAVREMNALRRARHAFTLAIDIPTGLGAGDLVVEADLTVTIGYVKSLLVEDAAAAFVGRLAIVPLKEVAGVKGDASQRVLTPECLLPALPCRSFDFHKGQAGRVGIIAGSRGYLGAAVLAASGALRGGAGLVTLYVKEDTYPLISGLPPAEVMVKPVRDYHTALGDGLDTLAIGPGLGGEHEEEILALLARAELPTVLDADALNMLGRRGLEALRASAAPRLLTPHPGEMARLATHSPEWKAMSRREVARAFAEKFPNAALLLKGSRSVISAAGQPLSLNSTGNPGMATGGMGDILTGLCAALAAQGVALYDAACLGAWLSGRAAERALLHGECSQESLVPSDVLQHLGGAFRDLRRQVF